MREELTEEDCGLKSSWSIITPCKAIELGKPGDIVPDLFVVGVEDVRTVFVDIDALNNFGINIASNIRAFVHHQNALTTCHGFMSENCAVKTGTYY